MCVWCKRGKFVNSTEYVYEDKSAPISRILNIARRITINKLIFDVFLGRQIGRMK